jgi:Tfp pilus assembly protein PilF
VNRPYLGRAIVSRFAQRTGILRICLATLGVAGCATSHTSDLQRIQARAAYERGLSDLREGRPALGLAALREAVTLDDDNAAYHNALGLLLLDLKKHPEALAEFSRAVTLDPTLAEAQQNLGVALAEAGRWEDAIAAYQKVLSIAAYATPDIAYHNLGWAQYNVGRYGEAEEALRLAVRLDPQQPGYYYTLGLVLLRTGIPQEAKAAFRRARELGPDSPFAAAASHHLQALGEGG